jgi:hypothetical protein
VPRVFSKNRDSLLEGDIAQLQGGRLTLGADSGYDGKAVVAALRNMVSPYVAQNTSGRRSANARRTIQHVGYAKSEARRPMGEGADIGGPAARRCQPLPLGSNGGPRIARAAEGTIRGTPREGAFAFTGSDEDSATQPSRWRGGVSHLLRRLPGARAWRRDRRWHRRLRPDEPRPLTPCLPASWTVGCATA